MKSIKTLKNLTSSKKEALNGNLGKLALHKLCKNVKKR